MKNQLLTIVPAIAIGVGLMVSIIAIRDKPATQVDHNTIKNEILPMYPQLQSIYDNAMIDKSLSVEEALNIMDTAKSIHEPDDHEAL